MADTNSSAGLTEVVGGLPYVGRTLGAMARLALKKGEQEALDRCLELALRPTHAKVGGRGLVKTMLHPGKTLVARSARRQAARDVIAVDALPAPLDGDSECSTETEVRLEAPAAPAKGEDEGLWDVRKLASEQLHAALMAAEFVPWTDRLSGVLTINAEAHWERLVREYTPDSWEATERFLSLVTNRAGATAAADRSQPPGPLRHGDFIAFGERVGLRLVANMATDEQLQSMVRRLDRQDSQRAEAALVTAAQGLRVAMLTVAVMLGFAVAALVEIAAD